MSDHPHPPTLQADADGLWECSVCARRVSTAYVGELECTTCQWTAIVWVACSKRCLTQIQTDLAPAMRGTRGGQA